MNARSEVSKQELLDRLTEVQEALLSDIAELKAIARADQKHYEWARAYIVSHLECVVTNDHEWLSRDQNISDWIEMLEDDLVDESLDEEFDGTTDEAGNEVCFICGEPIGTCNCTDELDGDEDDEPNS